MFAIFSIGRLIVWEKVGENFVRRYDLIDAPDGYDVRSVLPKLDEHEVFICEQQGEILEILDQTAHKAWGFKIVEHNVSQIMESSVYELTDYVPKKYFF